MRVRTTPIAAAVALFAVLAWSTVDAQQPQGAGAGGGRGGGAGRGRGPVPTGEVPRLANGQPDLTGLWNNPYTANMAANVVDPKTRQPLKFARQGEPVAGAKAPASGRGARTFDLPYTELGLQRWRDYDPVGDGDYTGNCLPFGFSRSINSPHGVQIVHHPEHLAFLFEQNTWHHWVPLKPGFKWPADIPAWWNGQSVGRWEGDTLIIETKNFNGYSKLDTSGHPHSTQLVLTNTFRRTAGNLMEHTVTVHDPKMYTQDWMNVRTWQIKAATDVLMEYSCDENNLQGIVEGSIKLWKFPETVD